MKYPRAIVRGMAPSLHALLPSAAQDDAVVRFVEAHWPREEWPRGIIFLPNRRSVTLVRDAFLRHIGECAVLLPTLLPLADIDPYLVLLSPKGELSEGKAAMPSFRRRWLLAEQVKMFFDAKNEPCSSRYAMLMADALGNFLDACTRSEANCADFSALVPAQFTTHWQSTLAFLAIVLSHWPRIEEEQGSISQAAFVHDGLKRLAKAWEASPPDIPILAAGSTGSQPATAELLRVIAHLPKGAVLVPGVPPVTEEYAETVVPGHPLFHVKHLATHCGASLASLVRSDMPTGAELFMRDAFSPIAMGSYEAVPENHHMLRAADECEEARAIALLVREALEQPERRAMVVASDRAVLRRVASALMRFGIVADSSSADRLHEHPFFQWCFRLLAMVGRHYAPLELLAFFQDGLTFAGDEHAFFVRWFDTRYARGIARARGMAPVEALLLSPDMPVEYQERALALRQGLLQLQVCQQKRADVSAWFDAISEMAEICGAARGASSEVEAVIDLLVAQAGEQAVDAGESALFLEYASDIPWFAPNVSAPHPRVMLHTPIEARMAQADVVVLAGLNEDMWPKVASNPWVNRAMQAALGLPTAEHEISLAAHDFMVLASQPEVYFSRAERMQGKVTTPSRWWRRLELSAERADGSFDTPKAAQVVAWARMLDVSDVFTPSTAPMPVPPVALRPRSLRATEMGELLFNPYAVYARHVLGLVEPEEIDKAPDNALFGTLAHRVLEKVAAMELVDDVALERLVDQAITSYSDAPSVALLWRARLRRVVRFFLAEHAQRAGHIEALGTEVDMMLALSCEGGEVHIRGRADRVETWRDGTHCFADYKSGAVPNKSEFKRGEAPQLVLYHMADTQVRGQALAAQTAHFAYWKLPGGAGQGEVSELALSAEEIAVLSQRYSVLCGHYLFSDTAFLYAPHGARGRLAYGALARAGEWGGPET